MTSVSVSIGDPPSFSHTTQAIVSSSDSLNLPQESPSCQLPFSLPFILGISVFFSPKKLFSPHPEKVVEPAKLLKTVSIMRISLGIGGLERGKRRKNLDE